MVNVSVLKEQVGKAPPNIPNGGEIFKHIFEKQPALRKFWDMEDFEPEQIAKSRQMQMKGAGFLSSLNSLVSNFENEKNFKLECCELRDAYKDLGLTTAEVKNFLDGVVSFFEAKLGKLTNDGKLAWAQFFDKYVATLKEAGLN